MKSAWFHEPLLTPSHAAYALISCAVIYGLGCIVDRARRAAKAQDPMASEHGDIPHIERGER